jgi:hypothetical protein
MNDVQQLKLTFWGHIRMIGFTLLMYTFFVFFTAYLYDPERPVLLLLMGMPLVFLIFPVFYVHYNYNTSSEGVSYELNRNVSITKFDNKGKNIYSINEFEQFKLIATRSKLISLPNKMMFGDYHYVKLKLINGEELTFTCLYSTDIYTLLKSYFPSIPITEKGVFYPTISEFDFE